MKYIIWTILLTLSSTVSAADPADHLRAHLSEMKKHLEVMKKYEGTDYKCTDLVEHVRQMTLHMEQMTEMIVKMHQTTPDHEMQHEPHSREGG